MTQDTEYPSRQLVVQFMTSRQYPVLTLTGKWMIDAGFTIRTPVNVHVRHEELLISVRH